MLEENIVVLPLQMPHLRWSIGFTIRVQVGYSIARSWLREGVAYYMIIMGGEMMCFFVCVYYYIVFITYILLLILNINRSYHYGSVKYYLHYY